MKTLYRSLALAISMLTATFILSSNAVAAPSLTVDVAPDETTFDSMREPGARDVGYYDYLNLPDSFSFHVTFGLRKHRRDAPRLAERTDPPE